MIEKILIEGDEQDISDAFYALCKKESQQEYIKELLGNEKYTKKFTRNVLNYGIIGALEENNEEYIHIIFNYINENNIDNKLYTIINGLLQAVDVGYEKTVISIVKYMDKNQPESDDNLQYLQVLYNYATSVGKDEFADTLDQNHSIVKKSISNVMPEQIRIFGQFPDWLMLDKGNLGVCKSLGNNNSRDKKANYLINPIVFNLNTSNYKLLDSLFEREHEIHPSLIIHAVACNIYLGNTDATSYLLSNQKCKAIIEASNEITMFLNNEKDYLDSKKEFKSKLLMNELTKELTDTNSTSKSKPKL